MCAVKLRRDMKILILVMTLVILGCDPWQNSDKAKLEKFVSGNWKNFQSVCTTEIYEVHKK